MSLVGSASRGNEVSEEQRVLDEHVAQFQALFDRAAIGMATLTVTGTVVRANDALAELMSCEPYDLVGVDYGQLTRGAGDQLDRGLHAITVRGEDLATVEHALPEGAGVSRLPGSSASRSSPIRDAQQQVLYVFAQVQDITALRAAEGDLRLSEENFRLLIAAVSEYAIFMLDRDGIVVSWNAGAQRIKGYSPAGSSVSSFRVFYPPEDRATGHPEQNLETARRDGEYAEEGWRVRKDGSQFWASVVISAVYDDAGRHIGFAKVTRDQSTQREHEQERKHLIDRADASPGRDGPRAANPHGGDRGLGVRTRGVVRPGPPRRPAPGQHRQQHAPFATPRHGSLDRVAAAAGNTPAPSRRRHVGHDPQERSSAPGDADRPLRPP